jgi:hypothetical protein
LQPLRGRNVVLFPDLSVNGIAFTKWAKQAEKMADMIRFRVSTMLEEAVERPNEAITAKELEPLLNRIKRQLERVPQRNEPFQIDRANRIVDTEKFLASHQAYITSHKGGRGSKPYMDRLQELTEKLEALQAQ